MKTNFTETLPQIKAVREMLVGLTSGEYPELSRAELSAAASVVLEAAEIVNLFSLSFSDDGLDDGPALDLYNRKIIRESVIEEIALGVETAHDAA